MNKNKLQRNANIELLRIISMLFIVMFHFNVQSEFNNYSFSVNSILISLLGFGGAICVNIFLIIGTWFMIDSHFDGKRVIKLWSNVFFYSFLLTSLIILIGVDVSMKDIIRGYLPFIGRALWFASAYITLIFIAPFLNYVFDLTRQKQLLLLGILFFSLCLLSTVTNSVGHYLINSIWCWFVYLCVGFYKKEIYEKKREKLQKYKGLSLFIGTIIYISLVLILHFATVKSDTIKIANALISLTRKYLYDIKTLPNILCAFLICNFVFLCNEKSVKIIGKISKSPFSVYIVHQVPVFFMYLWTDLYRANSFKDKSNSVLYLIFVAVSLYICVSIIDVLRRIIEKKWVDSRLFTFLSDGFNNLYKKAELI